MIGDAWHRGEEAVREKLGALVTGYSNFVERTVRPLARTRGNILLDIPRGVLWFIALFLFWLLPGAIAFGVLYLIWLIVPG